MVTQKTKAASAGNNTDWLAAWPVRAIVFTYSHTRHKVLAMNQIAVLNEWLIAELEDELSRKKNRLKSYRRQFDAASNPDAKEQAKTRLDIRCIQLRVMRQQIFAAQDAIEAAVKDGDAARFEEYESLFPDTSKALVEALTRHTRAFAGLVWVRG